MSRGDVSASHQGGGGVGRVGVGLGCGRFRFRLTKGFGWSSVLPSMCVIALTIGNARTQALCYVSGISGSDSYFWCRPFVRPAGPAQTSLRSVLSLSSDGLVSLVQLALPWPQLHCSRPEAETCSI